MIARMPHAADVTVLIPLRAGGKNRLASALTQDARWRLALGMLDGVVEAVRTAGITDVRVLSGGTEAMAAAQARGLPVVRDRDDDPSAEDAPLDARLLRRAVDDGLEACGSDRVRIVIAADLPLLTAGDVGALLETADRITVAPTRDGGTGALLLPTGCALATRYGRGSAAAHLEAARDAGWETIRLDRTGFGVDLDASADLDAIIALARVGVAPGGACCGHHTIAALVELGLVEHAPSRIPARA
jgi:2-phospho-L-lactate/phosphoenolpyruvate guanylyltransferase